jgi:hypothetical protein
MDLNVLRGGDVIRLQNVHHVLSSRCLPAGGSSANI